MWHKKADFGRKEKECGGVKRFRLWWGLGWSGQGAKRW